MKCLEKCKELGVSCPVKECKMWINYEKEMNCCYEAVGQNVSGMTLREIAERLGVSFVRVKQIQDKALEKLNKCAFSDRIY
jgi:hypothetical protein